MRGREEGESTTLPEKRTKYSQKCLDFVPRLGVKVSAAGHWECCAGPQSRHAGGESWCDCRHLVLVLDSLGQATPEEFPACRARRERGQPGQ